jgi:hypothetical protein
MGPFKQGLRFVDAWRFWREAASCRGLAESFVVDVRTNGRIGQGSVEDLARPRAVDAVNDDLIVSLSSRRLPGRRLARRLVGADPLRRQRQSRQGRQ